MSTPAKPQNVCKGCRSRKKRCDGNRPSCSSCTVRGELCYYERSNRRNLCRDRVSGHVNGATTRNPALQDWTSWPVDEVDALLGFEPTETIPSFMAGPQLEDSYEWIMPNNELLGTAIQASFPGNNQTLAIPQNTGSPTLPTPPKAPPELPELPELLQLIDLFFEKFYRYMPIIHRQTLMSAIESQGPQGVPPVLLFAIIAVSTSGHPDSRIRQSQRIWYEEAKNRVSKDIQLSHHVLQTLQAAVLVVYLGLALVDYSPCLVVLGEAWRKTVAIGHSYGDSLRKMIVESLGTQEKATWIEREETTRISWMLFIMDRAMCFPIGLMHAIDDRRMTIELPMSEHDFQSANEPVSKHTSRFTHNLSKLISTVRDNSLQGAANQLQYIILIYTFIGRISEALDFTDDEEERKERIESLCNDLIKIRLMLPRSATELSFARYDEFTQVLWLNMALNTCTILLHQRPLNEGESLDDTGTELAINWPHCVAAARASIAVLRDASRVSIDFVGNAHIPCLLFPSCRILTNEYFCPSKRQREARDADGVQLPIGRDPKVREDLEVIASAYARMKEEWPALGKKFGKGMYFYLHQGAEFARKSKVAGARSLVGVCDNWGTIPDDYKLDIPT
ncbi:fungal-specific transcription factor domain-containing protein [Trichoderma asperelloides]|nr:fungal-specific transcription factor domain-containing protein [Trichoderma asperelloides]